MTTVSIINPEVTYRESKTIDEEDIGHVSQVYELDVSPSNHIGQFLKRSETEVTSVGIEGFSKRSGVETTKEFRRENCFTQYSCNT